MPYKPTGKPPGRPRNTEPVVAKPDPVPAPQEQPEPKRLTRAREGFRRAYGDPTEGLYSLPRYGVRRRKHHAGKRPILHPNVINKA